MISVPWEDGVRAALAELGTSHLYRRRRIVTPLDAVRVACEGREFVNFASNSYLGLNHHPRVVDAAVQSLRRAGTGSGASALICGYGPDHASAESHIARWKQTESAVLLPSGYQANLAAIQTLSAGAEKSGRPIHFLLDKLCHASLIDAVRGVGNSFRVFPHNQFSKLRRLLQNAEPGAVQVVVTESIFSMDGDAADLRGLAQLKQEHPFVLLLDEAHGTGVYGPAGSGLAAELGLRHAVDVSVMTLSKAIGCAGGVVCGSKILCEALVNFARAYIYSTSLPPAVAASAEASVRVMEQEPERRQRVRNLSRRVRDALSQMGWVIPEGDSPIIPIIVDSESAALGAAEQLMEEGLLSLAIRPPTVPRGTSRLRLTLCSEHTDAQVENLLHAMRRLKSHAGGL